MKLWQKVGSGLKSNILILITLALWHKVTQSADALAHLISFMSWRIWKSQDTRVKQKVISASFAYLNLSLTVVKLSKSWLPSAYYWEHSWQLLVPWRVHRQNFLLKPNVDKNLWIRTISRGENWREVWIPHCRRFPQHELFSRSRPLHCFYVFSRLTFC